MRDIEIILANGPQTVMLRPEAIPAFLLVPLLLAGGTVLLVRRWPFLGRIAARQAIGSMEFTADERRAIVAVAA